VPSKHPAAVELGKLGGARKTPAKRATSAANGRRLKERCETAERCAFTLSALVRPICAQCGGNWSDEACGPSHAVAWAAIAYARSVGLQP